MNNNSKKQMKKRLNIQERVLSRKMFFDNEVDQQRSEQRGSRMTREERNSANDSRGHSRGL